MQDGKKQRSVFEVFSKSSVTTGAILLSYFAINNNYLALGKWEGYVLLLFLPTLVLVHKLSKFIRH